MSACTLLLNWRWLVCGLMAAASGWVSAQQPQAPAGGVYRCGNSYSDTPCPGGQAVAADDARSAAQQRQAQQVKQRESALAEQLAAERRAREQAAVGQRAAGFGPLAADAAKPAKPPASAPKPRPVKQPKPRPAKPPQPTKPTRAG